MLHQFYATWSRQMLEHSRIITSYRGVICRGTRFHSRSQCSIWPAPRVSQCREFSSGASRPGASCCILCALALANLQFWHPYRVLLIGELLTFRIRNPSIPAHLTTNPSIPVHLTTNPSIPVHLSTSYIATADCRPRYKYEPLMSSLLKPSMRASDCILLD